jgi:hypothetical protein
MEEEEEERGANAEDARTKTESAAPPASKKPRSKRATKRPAGKGDPWDGPPPADPWSDAPSSPYVFPYAPNAVYDHDLNALVRVAARVGQEKGINNAINFTTLLIALAIGHDPASRFLQEKVRFLRYELLASRMKPDARILALIASEAKRATFPATDALYSASAKTILDKANYVAGFVGARSIGTRHLMCSIFLYTPSEHRDELERQWGFDLQAFGIAFPPFVAQTWPTESKAWLQLFLQDKLQVILPREHTPAAAVQEQAHAQEASTATVERARYVAAFGADDPVRQLRDLLDVRDEARAFARIAASRNTQLPLSVGVFGEWGSGKTFFMGLMAKHVKKLSAEAPKDEEESLFLPDIVQITFNAWHYIEINLWASLVEYIFSELDRKLQQQNPREQVDGLFEQLSTSRVLKLEAIDELIVKRTERKKAEERLDRAQRDYEAALLRQSSSTAPDFWQAVWTTFRTKLDEEGVVADVEKLGGELGLKDLSKSAQSLNEVLKEAETEAGRARVLSRAMVAKVGDLGWVVTVAAVLVAVPLAVIVMKGLLVHLSSMDWVRNINEAVLALSGVIATASVFAGRAVHAAKSALAQLEGFRQNLDAAVKQRTEEFKQKSDAGGQFADAERDMARLKNELEQAKRKLAEADKLSDQVLRDYHSATARGRLSAFIRDKLASDDYAKHLGLVATIRKDFEQLSQLMAETGKDSKAREKYKKEHAEYRKRLMEKLEKAKKEKALSDAEFAELSTDSSPAEPGLFTRIILYIDDLDRCPAEKVVEVLQAIHLLLYFPLFVVVVAVDARWVSRSLRERYPQLLSENITDSRRDPELLTAATSHDYLEKIFQIPYWVPPMDLDASMNYVEKIAQRDVRRSGPASRGQQQTGSVPAPNSSPDASPPPPRVDRPGDGTVPAGTPPTAVSLSGTQGTQTGTPQTATEPRDEDDGDEQAAYVAKGMELSVEEHKFLKQLAPFVGSTPRRGLRFVNVYRLVKTGLSEALQTELQEENNHLSYRALITQLAIVTGAPHIAWSYFQSLENAVKRIKRREANPSELIKEGETDTLADLRTQLTGDLPTVYEGQRTALLGALERLYQLNTQQDFDTGRQLLLALHRFATVARRYSFTARPH